MKENNIARLRDVRLHPLLHLTTSRHFLREHATNIGLLQTVSQEARRLPIEQHDPLLSHSRGIRELAGQWYRQKTLVARSALEAQN